MADSTTQPGSQRARRGRTIAWRIGWALLALVSFCVTYVLLVVGGR
jgi:hypothetical protein